MMTADMLAKLKRSLIEHEGRSNFLYPDTVGKPTIGVGYNIADRGLSDAWINTQLQSDIDYFYQQLCTFDWFHSLNDDRQIVLIDMCFNLGFKNFCEFTNMISDLEAGNYASASYAMLDSKWAEQVHSRATQLANGMLTGSYNV